MENDLLDMFAKVSRKQYIDKWINSAVERARKTRNNVNDDFYALNTLFGIRCMVDVQAIRYPKSTTEEK